MRRVPCGVRRVPIQKAPIRMPYINVCKYPEFQEHSTCCGTLARATGNRKISTKTLQGNHAAMMSVTNDYQVRYPTTHDGRCLSHQFASCNGDARSCMRPRTPLASRVRVMTPSSVKAASTWSKMMCIAPLCERNTNWLLDCSRHSIIAAGEPVTTNQGADGTSCP
jgi:hypothetical protein